MATRDQFKWSEEASSQPRYRCVSHSPLKNKIKSQPVHTNNICITAGASELGIGARSGSSVKALMRACISRYLFSSDMNRLGFTITSRDEPATIGKPTNASSTTQKGVWMQDRLSDGTLQV